MSELLAQVVFQGGSGLPADVYVNTFHFTASDPPGTDPAGISSDLQDFYNVSHPGAADDIASFMSPNLIRAESTIKVYDLDDPIPRIPLFTEVWTLGPTAGVDGLPNEVALCLSYKGIGVGGIPAARQRGRIYLGPWRANDITDINGDSAPTAGLTASVAAAGDFLANGATTAAWVVRSQAQVDDALSPHLFIVTQGFVDNAWDTQRRRGNLAQTRTLWP